MKIINSRITRKIVIALVIVGTFVGGYYGYKTWNEANQLNKQIKITHKQFENAPPTELIDRLIDPAFKQNVDTTKDPNTPEGIAQHKANMIIIDNKLAAMDKLASN